MKMSRVYVSDVTSGCVGFTLLHSIVYIAFNLAYFHYYVSLHTVPLFRRHKNDMARSCIDFDVTSYDFAKLRVHQ